MRRQDRQITDRKTIDDIIRRSHVCRLGMSDGARPYVVPMHFGYDGRMLYFHGAPEGRKLDILRRNPRVCFEFDIPGELLPAKEACGWGRKFESVVGFGTAKIVQELEAKRHALAWIMRQYAEGEWTFPESAVDEIVVLSVEIEEISGKARR